MAARAPRQDMDGPSSANDTGAPSQNAAAPGRIVTHGFAPRAPATRPAPTTMVKDGLTETPQAEEGPPDYAAAIRESWMSSASTAASRDSAVPSLFDARASIISASTRYSVRQSSIESPIWDTSPIHEEHCKDDCPRPSRYWCTFCDASFDDLTEWKLHEFDFHDRRDHGNVSEPVGKDNDTGPVAAPSRPLRYSAIRSAWGCGFCAAVILARSEYLDHIGNHYDDGKDKSDWQHTRVIEGLLRQPKTAPTWTALVDKEESARGSKLRFVWNSETTGRATDAGEPRRLQDMLEFFATGGKTADEVVAVAYSSADVRPEGNVSELISKHYMRHPERHSARPTPTPAQPPPDLRRVAATEPDDVISPLSPLPAPIPCHENLTQAPPGLDPAQVPHALHSFSAREARGRSAKLVMETLSLGQDAPPPAARVSASPSDLLSQQPPLDRVQLSLMKQSNLRRVDSSRSIVLSNQPDAAKQLADQDASVVSQTRVRSATPQLQTQGAPVQAADDSRKTLPALNLEATASIRPHTSSSTLSTHTGDGSHGLVDSTSETMSDDSVSEPDSWLEVNGRPASTRSWRSAFQQRADQRMAQLWARYIRDWDALVVNQRPGGSSQHSSQSQASFGPTLQGTSSYQAFNQGPGLSSSFSGPFDEEDEDDDDDNYLQPPSLPKLSPTFVKRFACPYRKHDPHTYNMQNHEVCTVRSWSTISRLKEHLYRRHYKIHCQRCKRMFRNDRELDEHEMSQAGCEVLHRHSPCDMTTHQHKQLRMKKHTSRRQTDVDKWNDIYQLLFPHEQIPSPYPEPADDMTHVSSESQTSLGYQHFLLAELPGLFTRTAEEHVGRRLQAREGLAMDAIPRILDEAIRKAFTAWKARGSEVPAAAWNSSPHEQSSTSNSVQSYHTPQPTMNPALGGIEIEYPLDNSEIPLWDSCGPPPTDPNLAVDLDQIPIPDGNATWQAMVDMVERGGPFESELEMGGYQFTY